MKKSIVSFLLLLLVAVSALGIGGPPQITTQPVSRMAAVGQNAAFKVIVTSVTFLTYQWYKNGVAIPGATLYRLGIPSVTFDSSGSFYCAVTNGAGTINTVTVTLVVFSQ